MKNLFFIFAFSFIGLHSNAQFGSPIIIDSTISQTVIKIITADLNNDGKKDIITSHYQDQINWYNNLGGTFSSKQNITNNISHPFHLDVGDANGDGFIDVLATDDNGNESKVVLFLNNFNGTNWNKVVIDSAIQVAAFKSFFADLDNDGDLDIITNTDLEITIYLNLGMNNFSNRIVVANTNEFYNITVNDFNNDNFKDFAVHSGHGLQIYFNNTNSTFTLIDTIDPDLHGFIISEDVDNDNDFDIISGSNTNSFYNTFKNDGTGNFTFFESTQFNCPDIQKVPFMNADLNSDSFKDALYVFDFNINWRQNNGFGNFISPILIDSTYQYLNIFAEDIDNDLDKDIIWYGKNININTLGTILNNNVTSLQNKESAAIATVVPNPAIEMISIQTDIDFFEIKIIDIFGKTVLNSKVKNIDISELVNGIYIVTIHSKENQYSAIKLIKE